MIDITEKETNYDFHCESIHGNIYINKETGHKGIHKVFNTNPLMKSNIRDAFEEMAYHPNSQKILEAVIGPETTEILFRYDLEMVSLAEFRDIFSDNVDRNLKIEFIKSVAFQMANYLTYLMHRETGRNFHGSMKIEEMYVTNDGFLLIQPSMSDRHYNDMKDCGRILSSLFGGTGDRNISQAINLFNTIDDPVLIIDFMIRAAEPYERFDEEIQMFRPRDSLKRINDPWSIDIKDENLPNYKNYLWKSLRSPYGNYFAMSERDISSSVTALERSSKLLRK